MQESDGSMKMLTEEEMKIYTATLLNPKVIGTDQYFKIKHCFFKITEITPEGIQAKGVSRREYFEREVR